MVHHSINTIVVDCDGCLTDGKKYVDDKGERALMAFHARDNTAIRRLIESGYRVIIVTASRFSGTWKYWGKYNVEVVSTKEKTEIEGIDWARSLGVGDDLMDIEFLRLCAVAYVPSDAHPRLLGEFNHLVTKGGRGVMAEIENKLSAFSFVGNGAKYVYNGTTY